MFKFDKKFPELEVTTTISLLIPYVVKATGYSHDLLAVKISFDFTKCNYLNIIDSKHGVLKRKYVRTQFYSYDQKNSLI